MNLLKMILSISSLALLTAGSALASCPQIEGKYVYTCTVQKDSKPDFGQILDIAGEMLVQQRGCGLFSFTNLRSQEREDFDLESDGSHGKHSETKIKKSNANLIRFAKSDSKLFGFAAWVTKGTIRDRPTGFTLTGREFSRVLGIFGKRHSKFSCQFRVEN